VAVIDGLGMVARARAFVGRHIVPQGMCLNFVWQRAGGLASIGASVRRMGTAFQSWQATPEHDRHHGDWDAPIGSVIHYGPSPTRTDRNKNAGDIGISIGGGYGIFTDAAGQGARVGIMSLRARAAQIGRPYLGWASSLGGHTIRLATTATAGEIREAIANAPTAQEQEYPMSGHVLISHPQGQIHVIAGVPVDLGPGNSASVQVTAGAPTTRIDMTAAAAAEYLRRARGDNEERILFRGTGGVAMLSAGALVPVGQPVVDALTRAGVQVVDISTDEFDALAKQFPAGGAA